MKKKASQKSNARSHIEDRCRKTFFSCTITKTSFKCCLHLNDHNSKTFQILPLAGSTLENGNENLSFKKQHLKMRLLCGVRLLPKIDNKSNPSNHIEDCSEKAWFLLNNNRHSKSYGVQFFFFEFFCLALKEKSFPRQVHRLRLLDLFEERFRKSL